ncbi:hypothetical protein C7212DRAFT_194999, partial [Tuber magnatum]
VACCRTLQARWGRSYWWGLVVSALGFFYGWVHRVYHGSMTCGSGSVICSFAGRGPGLFPLILFIHYLGLLID